MRIRHLRPGSEPTTRTPWWDDLGLWARFSIAGLAVAAILAIGLSWYIPKWVGERFLETQAAADQTVLTALTETEALVVDSDADYSALDAFVESALLRRQFVRVKLWLPDGTIVYSDDRSLVGRVFAPDADFAALTEPVSEVSDLAAEENEVEREQFSSDLLETYVPVRSETGELVAVWEVYHLLDDFDAAVTGTQRTVRIAVGAGLGLLAIFLVSVFGGLVASVQRRRREAEQRSDDLSTALNILRSTAVTLDSDEMVEQSARHLGESGRFDWFEIGRTDRGGNRHVLASTRDGAEREKVAASVGATTSLSNGAIDIAADLASDADRRSAEALLQTAVEELAISMQRAELYDDLESSRARLRVVMQKLVSAQETERQRIVGDIHDGLGQDLHRVLFSIRGCLNANPMEVEVELRQLEQLVSSSSGTLRKLLQELHPSTITDLGLAASLRSLTDRLRNQFGLRVELRLAEFDEPSQPASLAVFRIAQEALINVVKHSGTLVAKVSIHAEDDMLELTVTDYGAGMAGGHDDGLGMWLMSERAEGLGGSFEVDSSPAGTSIRARVPVGVGS